MTGILLSIGEAIEQLILTSVGVTAVGSLVAVALIGVVLVVAVAFPLLLFVLWLVDRCSKVSIPRPKRLLWAALPCLLFLLYVAYICFDIATKS